MASNYFIISNDLIKKRAVDNKAWKMLNLLKQNCYFYIGDSIKSCLLWFSDLAFRMYAWNITNDDISLVNRYYFSIKSCIISNYLILNSEKLNDLKVLIENIIRLFPNPKFVFVLDISIDIELKRLNNYRNKVLSDSEVMIAKLNSEQFYNLNDNNVYHLNSNMNIKEVFNEFVDIIEKNRIIY